MLRLKNPGLIKPQKWCDARSHEFPACIIVSAIKWRCGRQHIALPYPNF